MSSSDATNASPEALETESLAWLNRLLSGAVTHDQAAAFRAWRAISPAHEQAFAEAARFRHAARRAITADREARDAAPRRAVRPRLDAPVGGRASRVTRRALVGGGLAASAAAYLVARPPGGLWPSWKELSADYRTGPGERRDMAVAEGVSVELNTRTSVARGQAGGRKGIELVGGEAAVTVRSSATPFVVAAGAGHVLVADGIADVRNDRDQVCVTCLQGAAEVIHPRGRLQLGPGEQAVYAGERLGTPTQVDVTVAAAWRRGLLIFRDAPLQQVVDELNRYRDGRIVLVDAALARRPVYGVFQIRQIATAVRQVQALTGAKATTLPGGLTLLS